MMSESDWQTRVWSEADSEEVEISSFCGGNICVYTHACPTRDTSPNEDAACIFQNSDATGVIAVADGVGGAAAGSKASLSAVRHLVDACTENQPTEADDARGLRIEILDAIESANAEILKQGIGAGTTLTAVEIVGDRFRAYHVGDSSAMLVSNRGRIKFVTVGHAPVAQAVDIGMMDEKEALRHEDRNLITNCLGSETMKIEIGPSVKIAPRDTLLIASDGLFDNLTHEQIAGVIRKGDLLHQTSALVDLVNQKMNGSSASGGKPDDLTIACWRPSK